MSKISNIISEAIITAKHGADDKYIQQTLNKIDSCTVKVYREDDTVNLPIYAKPGDACMDIYAHNITYDTDKNRVIIHTGLHFALPEDYEMEIRPRSSNTKTRWVILNAPGTLDEGYRGEMLVIFTSLDDTVDITTDFPYSEGDRVCQILVRRREKIVWSEVKSLEDLGHTERGEGGFGSTNK